MSRLVCVYIDRYARRIIYNVIHNGIIYYTNGRLLVVPVQCAKIRDRRRSPTAVVEKVESVGEERGGEKGPKIIYILYTDRYPSKAVSVVSGFYQ
jgi:hypothetical protein